MSERIIIHQNGFSKAIPKNEFSESLGKLDKGYTLQQIRELPNDKINSTKLFYAVESGKFGFWYLDGDDNVLSDNNSTKIVTVGGQVIKRIIEDYVVVDMFGGYLGHPDESEFIQKAIDYCDTYKFKLKFLPRQYNIKRQLRIKNIEIVGIPRKTKIVIQPDFLFTETITGRNYSCILNNDYRGDVNAYSNDFEIYGIDVEARLTSTIVAPSILGFANVKAATIDNCNVKVLDGLIGVNATNIDLWACCKNVKIKNCNLENLNQSVAGGVVWIRNLTNNGSNSVNNTENVVVQGCSISSRSKDEPVAVYGVQGLTKNVKIKGNAIVALPSSQIHSVLISVFPLNNGTSYGAYAGVKDVKIQNNNVTDYYFGTHVVRVGQSGIDTGNICDNVKVSSNTFNVSKTVAEASYVIRNIKNIGNNVVAHDNDIYVDSLSVSIGYGISGFDKVSENYFSGAFGFAIANSKKVKQNILDKTTGSGINNCEKVENNDVVCTGSPVVINSANVVYNVLSNYLESTSTTANNAVGIFQQSVAGLNPSVRAVGNTIKMNYVGNYALRREGIGNIDFIDNNVIGNGATVLVTNSGTMGNIVRGNSWYGILDERRSTAFNSVSTFYPIGTETKDASNGKVCWKKVANTNTSSDWGVSGYSTNTQLVAGTKTLTITGVTLSVYQQISIESPSNTADTKNYQVTKGIGTVTITALKVDGTVNTADTSIINILLP